MPEHRNQVLIRLVVLAFFVHLGLGMWFVERGLLNADEGWYLYAARQISLGWEPYQDFGLFQPPVYPTVLSGTVDAGPGALLAGRWLSWFLLAVGTGATVLAAARLSGVGGALIAAVGLGLHPVVVNHGVLAKPYGLTVLLLGAGLLLVSSAQHKTLRVGIGFFLMALACGTRLSLMAPAVVLACFQPARWVACVGFIVGLMLAFHGAIGVEPSALFDQWIGFHLADGGSLWDRAGWVVHVGTVWLVAVCAWVPGKRANTLPGLVPASVVAVAVHLLPAALHVEHLVAVAPLLVLAAADRWGSVVQDSKRMWAVVVGGAIVALMSRPFVHLDTAVASLRQNMDVGKWLADHTPKDVPILTVQLALAVEADRSVVSGLEMARFGWDPDLDAATARRTHRMSAARLELELSRPVGAIAFTEGDFDAEYRAKLVDAAENVFPFQRTVDDYGQFSEPLQLHVTKGDTLWMR